MPIGVPCEVYAVYMLNKAFLLFLLEEGVVKTGHGVLGVARMDGGLDGRALGRGMADVQVTDGLAHPGACDGPERVAVAQRGDRVGGSR